MVLSYFAGNLMIISINTVLILKKAIKKNIAFSRCEPPRCPYGLSRLQGVWVRDQRPAESKASERRTDALLQSYSLRFS